MTLWIGNGAVLKSSSEWQSNEFLKLNNSVHELFIFKIYLIAIDGTYCVITRGGRVGSRCPPFFVRSISPRLC